MGNPEHVNPWCCDVCLRSVFPKNRGTPKWMVKIMEHPIKIDDLGGKPSIFGNFICFKCSKSKSFTHSLLFVPIKLDHHPQGLGRKWNIFHLLAIAIYFHYDVKLIFRSNSPIRRCFDRKRFPHQMSPRYPKVPALWNDLPESPQKIHENPRALSILPLKAYKFDFYPWFF